MTHPFSFECVCVCLQSCYCSLCAQLLWGFIYFWSLRAGLTVMCVCFMNKYCTCCTYWAWVQCIGALTNNFSSVSAVKPTEEYTRGSVVMVDEIINSSPPHYRFPEAGLRVMITNHFGPKTRLRMASRLIINEVRKYTSWVNGNHILVHTMKVNWVQFCFGPHCVPLYGQKRIPFTNYSI